MQTNYVCSFGMFTPLLLSLSLYKGQSKKDQPLSEASVIDLMKHFGYNTHRPSWQSHLAAQPRVELEKPKFQKFAKDVAKCTQISKKPQPRVREQMKE